MGPGESCWKGEKQVGKRQPLLALLKNDPGLQEQRVSKDTLLTWLGVGNEPLSGLSWVLQV